MGNNDKISPYQCSVLVIMTLIGIGILSLSSSVADKAGPDGWILIIGGGIASLISAWMIATLCSMFPEDTVFEFSEKLLGKFFSYLITVILLIHFVTFDAFEIRVFGEVIKVFLLDRTPIEVIIISFIITSLYPVRHGIEPLARLSEIFGFTVIISGLLLYLANISNMDLTNLLPFLRTPPTKLLTGVFATFLSYLGYEITFILAPHISDVTKLRSSVIWGVFIVMIFYLTTVIVLLSVFGVIENKHMIWPLLTLGKMVDFPGLFLENLESLVMTLWILTVFTTFAPFLYTASVLLAKLFNSKEFNYFPVALSVVIYFLSLIPQNVVELYKLIDLFSYYLGTFVVFVIPLILLIAAKIRGYKMTG